MSKRDIVPSLKDILEAIDRIQRYVGALSLAEFLANSEKQDAVVRNLEIIGEAVRTIPPEFRKEHDDIAWSQVAGFRVGSSTSTLASTGRFSGTSFKKSFRC